MKDVPLTAQVTKPAPPWRHFGTRIATAFERLRGKKAIRAAVKAQAAAPTTANGKYNRKSAQKLGWTLGLLQQTFPTARPSSWDDDAAFRGIQRQLDVKVDGQFGSVSYTAMMKRHFAVNFIIVAGFPYAAPPGIRVHNWYFSTVRRFVSKDRRGRTVNVAVGHESVDPTASRTVATLLKKACGVHLMCTETVVRDNDGLVPLVTQHADLAWERLTHAAGENGPSVGIEGVSRYYASPGERPVVRGGWVHKGLYAVPPIARLEAFAALIDWLSSGAVPELTIPRTWVGLDRDGRLSMSRVKTASRRPGVAAHCYTDHADAAFFVLYALLRIECGLSPADAYDAALGLASTPRSTVDISSYLPADPGWKERAAA